MSSPSEIDRLQHELETLRESAEKYRLLIETTNTGFVILDESGRVLDANPEYVNLTGHDSLEQLLGRPVTEWTAPDDRERNVAEIRRCLATGNVRNLEIHYVGRNGRHTPIEINATVHRVAARHTILTICRDVTVRRQAAEALRSSEGRYRTTIDSMGEAIHVVDADLRIQLLNRTGELWLRGLGISGPLVGRSVFEVFPFLSDQVRDEYRRVFAGEGMLITQETNTVAGQEVITETRKIPMMEDGGVSRVVTVVRDVTEAVRAQEKLRQTEKLDAIGQLASGIAHDFNNQLGAMLGFAELISSNTTDARLKEYAAGIVKVSLNSAELVRQLLTFGRKAPARTVPVDLHFLIREVAGILRRTIDPRISIGLQLEAELAIANGDPAQLQSALLNLGLNARDAMPQGGQMTFATSMRPARGDGGRPQICLRVIDSGTGMSEQVRRRAFEPFFTTKGPGDGTGMGLAAVYGTVTAHRGTIEVESELGRGTTFTLCLPRVSDIDTADTPSAKDESVRGKGHILLADDLPSVRQITSELLTGLGYSTSACEDGLAALEVYRETWRDIDMVLLDVMMPRLDGPSTLAEMRKINPGVRAILFSGHPPSLETQRLMDETGAGFLQKPFTKTELAKCTNSVLSMPSAIS
jgi:PAS domain S-box-containing protein